MAEYDDPFENNEIEDEDDFNWPTELPEVKRIALYISDASGAIEDILIDIDEILEYVKKIYATYPSAN